MAMCLCRHAWIVFMASMHPSHKSLHPTASLSFMPRMCCGVCTYVRKVAPYVDVLEFLSHGAAVPSQTSMHLRTGFSFSWAVCASCRPRHNWRACPLCWPSWHRCACGWPGTVPVAPSSSTVTLNPRVTSLSTAFTSLRQDLSRLGVCWSCG